MDGDPDQTPGEKHVITPGSATDLARSVREGIGALRDMMTFSTDMRRLFDRRKARKAAQAIYGLAFTPRGMRAPLERIASGNGSSDDFRAIARRMRETASGVAEKIELLTTKLEIYIRENHGMKFSQELDSLIYYRKLTIRDDINKFLYLMEHENWDSSKHKSDIDEILKSIKRLNKQLSRVHDKLLPPRKSK
jgi:hypothetical protein